MKICFSIDYHTQWGERLYVCGSIPALGEWNTAKAAPMQLRTGERWELELEIPPKATTQLAYNYFVANKGDGIAHYEWGSERTLSVDSKKFTQVKLHDFWRPNGNVQNDWHTSAFTHVLMKRKPSPNGKPKKTAIASGTPVHRFQIPVPRIGQEFKLCLTGSLPELGNWDEKKAIVLDESAYPIWKTEVALNETEEPLFYKYGIYDEANLKIVAWEEGPNRSMRIEQETGLLTVRSDESFRYPIMNWRGTGVAIPVFSLRSREGLGVGEFPDIKLLVDWANQVGLKLIQILPINDTVATHTWVDSYPYAAISVVALHPIYLRLEAMGTLKSPKEQKQLAAMRDQLNQLDHVDYEAVMTYKSRYFKLLYDQTRKDFLADPTFKSFFDTNQHWLVPYAAFSRLRDLYGTSDFSQWEQYATITPEQLQQLTSPSNKDYDDIAIHYFIQFHLDRQLAEAAAYARERGVVLKGDIPIGIYRNSVDAWVAPQLFHMDSQSGAPPDQFSTTGQNWKFPTYRWEEMAKDGYAWWQERLKKMSSYFDAFRIDHILGFFRIWEIPLHAVDGLLGQFSPCLPLSQAEIAGRGIQFDALAFQQRFCEPYIREHMLWEIFGDHAPTIKEHYLEENQAWEFRLKPQFSTQRQIEEHIHNQLAAFPEQKAHFLWLKSGLFRLTAEVLFLEAPHGKPDAYSPRIAFHSTYSYRELDEGTRQRLDELYNDFFYRRHEEFWREQGLTKLPALKKATNMLVCGEDLGMVPDCVPGVMAELGLLSLAIQRMPKDPGVEFGNPYDVPYLTVCSTSSHDTSTLRAWWEEDRERTQRYYNHILGHYGEAPYFCEPWVVQEILAQHLYSPAMWAIFPIQDLIATDIFLRLNDPKAERINVPDNPQHYWKYRFHLEIENLLQQEEFNEHLHLLLTESGRNEPY